MDIHGENEEVKYIQNKSISIEDIIDLEFLQAFQDAFAISTGAGALFFSKNMEAITKPSNFKEICSDFFRKCPKSCAACRASDKNLILKISETKKPYISHCKNGLIDFGAPVVLNDEVIGTLIAGQVLIQDANIKEFFEYGNLIGADVEHFMKALEKVPVIKEDKVEAMLKLLTLVGEKLSELAYKSIVLQEKNYELEEEMKKRILAEENLKHFNDELEKIIKERTLQLETSNKILEESLENLRKSQDYLIQTQKMAALGSLVVGISHELNTPLGIAITSSTYITQIIEDILSKYEMKTLKGDYFVDKCNQVLNSCEILNSSLNRSTNLVDNFKQIAIDQTNYEYRNFKLREYIDKIILSMNSDLNSKNVKIDIECDENLELKGYPGILTQIIINLIQNSLVHGFYEKEDCNIKLGCKIEEENVIIFYRDNGVGMTVEQLNRAFEPFYTTKLGQGRNGLGLFMVYNLVISKLGGRIKLESHENEGVNFEINIPLYKKY